jgi:hypothetical protein
MLEIEPNAVPTTEQARMTCDAAKEALEQLARERESLPQQHKDAVQRGDFETSRRIKDQMALLQDHTDFAALQLLRAEAHLLGAQVREAERDAQLAAEQLTRAFGSEELAEQAAQEARGEAGGTSEHAVGDAARRRAAPRARPGQLAPGRERGAHAWMRVAREALLALLRSAGCR